jgi:hypothetical protein
MISPLGNSINYSITPAVLHINLKINSIDVYFFTIILEFSKIILGDEALSYVISTSYLPIFLIAIENFIYFANFTIPNL